MEKAKETLKSFLENWKISDFQKMHNKCQKTYKVGHTKNELKSIMAPKLKSYKIGEVIEIVQGTVIDFELTLKIDNKQLKSKARVICEIEPFKASASGEWGVNPISINKPS